MSNNNRPWSLGGLGFAFGVLVLIALGIVLTTAPLASILGPSAHAISGALHGLLAFIMLVVSTIALYLAYRLLTGRLSEIADLQLVTAMMSALSFLTLVWGNMVYIPYRDNAATSPKSHFLATVPEVHKIFFEFKEYVALFTLPLAVAAAYIVWHYASDLLRMRSSRIAVALLIGLHYFYFCIAFGLGAAVTKLMSI